MIRVFLTITCLLLFSFQCRAAIDVYEFESDENRARYQKFLDELRCPKCKNQNLAGTNSEIAEDLRRELYRMIENGQSDEEIIDFMVSRYGDFVLYRPRFQSTTVALWLGPALFMFIGLMVLAVIVVRRRRLLPAGDNTLSLEERQRLESMLASRNKNVNS